MSSPVLYPLVKAGARLALPRIAPVEVHGLENLPDSGGALLLANHQSALDPFVLQTWSPRPVRAMTKSTQFGSPFMKWVLPRLGAFPVRRFQVDPQSVRTVLRLLAAGEWVCIYPEGERSWDARLQPFRRGALRTGLAAIHLGTPVVPVGLDGMYDLLPRWGRLRRPDRAIRLSFGEPIRMGPFADRKERDDAIPEMRRKLQEALLQLSGEAARERTAEPGGASSPWEEASSS
ncbi:lysophospholipid acyltransferase family protein [soil metagenome]